MDDKGVAAGVVPGGNNVLVGQEVDMSVSRHKDVPNLWGQGGRMLDVEKKPMESIDDVERYLTKIRTKTPSPPPKRNMGGEAVAQMLPDYPLEVVAQAITPAGCVDPKLVIPDDDLAMHGDGYRGGSATAAATHAAEAVALYAQASAKLRDAQSYMNNHTHQVWDPVTGSYAARKGKDITETIGATLDTAPSQPFKYGGSRVVLCDKEPVQGLVAETTSGLHGAYAASRGHVNIRYSGVGHQTGSVSAPNRT